MRPAFALWFPSPSSKHATITHVRFRCPIIADHHKQPTGAQVLLSAGTPKDCPRRSGFNGRVIVCTTCSRTTSRTKRTPSVPKRAETCHAFPKGNAETKTKNKADDSSKCSVSAGEMNSNQKTAGRIEEEEANLQSTHGSLQCSAPSASSVNQSHSMYPPTPASPPTPAHPRGVGPVENVFPIPSIHPCPSGRRARQNP